MKENKIIQGSQKQQNVIHQVRIVRCLPVFSSLTLPTAHLLSSLQIGLYNQGFFYWSKWECTFEDWQLIDIDQWLVDEKNEISDRFKIHNDEEE
jgi:hypothetical protein